MTISKAGAVAAMLAVTAVSVGAQTVPTPLVLTPTSSGADFAVAVSRSKFIFSARVLAVQATTTASLPASPQTAVVLVSSESDTVIMLPVGFRDLRGRRITLSLQRDNELTNGDQHLFFAYGIASDTGLVLREVARADYSPSNPGQYSKQIAAAREQLAAARTRAELSGAAAVVLGTVVSVSADLPRTSRSARSEHAPRWRRVGLRVEQSFGPATQTRGALLGALLNISSDVAFGGMPRVDSGQLWLFVLRNPSTIDPGALAGIDAHGLFVLLDADDVRPAADTAQVKKVFP